MRKEAQEMAISIVSFSYRKGDPPKEAVVIDCRVLNNPHSVPALRNLTGKRRDVQQFVQNDPHYEAIMQRAREAVGLGDTVVAFGCVGGRHRSVAVAELFAAELIADGNSVHLEHR